MSAVDAGCAIHINQPFSTICPRCGTYMCSLCSDHGRFTLCAGCRERTGAGTFPLTRERWTFEALLRHSWDAYKRNMATVTLGVLITMVIVIGVSGLGVAATVLIGDNVFLNALFQLFVIVLQTFAQGLLTLGMIAIALAAARGERPTLGMLFGQMPRIVGWVIQGLVTLLAFAPGGLVIGIATAVAIAVGEVPVIIGAIVIGTLVGGTLLVYAGLGVTFATTELVADPKIGALSAMKKAWNLVEGQRAFLLLALLIAAGFILLGMLMCGVGVVFAIAFASVMFAALYLALKNGTVST